MNNNILRILLILSAVGSLLTVLVCALSSLAKRLPANWLRTMATFTLLSFVIPFWLALPVFPHSVPEIHRDAELQEWRSAIPEAECDALPKNQGILSLIGKLFASAIRRTRMNPAMLVSVVWGIGTILSISRVLLPYVHFQRKLVQGGKPYTSDGLFETCRTQIGVKQQVKVILTALVSSPSLVGLLRPVILLPLTTISHDDQYVVFLHELTHLKSHDLVRKWLAALIKCVHWWNPFAYLAARLLDLNCETACDLAVAARLDDAGRIAYMRTILFFAASNGRKTALAASLSARGREIERRLNMIQNHKPVKGLPRILIYLSSALLVAAGLSMGAFAMSNLPVAEENASNSVSSAVTQNTTGSDSLNVPTGSASADSTEIPDFVWPVPGFTENNSAYGWRIHPILNTRSFHPGEDIPAPDGTPVSAAQSGKVTYAGWMEEYGNYTVISHGNGFSTAYGCLSDIQVSVGQNVAAGQQIGSVGQTGKATGSHLHFEVYLNAETQNPMKYFD